MRLFGLEPPAPLPAVTRSVRNLFSAGTATPTPKKKQDQRDNLLKSSKLQQRRRERVERQARLEAYIYENPGKTFEQLKSLFGVVHSVLYVDLRELVTAGRLSVSRYKQTNRWGPPGYAYAPAAQPTERKARVPLSALLLAELHTDLWITTTQLQCAMSQYDVSRGNLIGALQRLRQKGLVEMDDSERPAQWRKRGHE